MGWTERKEILKSYKEIVNYLNKENCFHDNRIGYLTYSKNEIYLTFEEGIPDAKIKDNAGLVWDFRFKNITFFEMSFDVVLGFWIIEVEAGKKPNEIVFNLDSGSIAIASEQIEFGIPKQE